MDLKIFSGRSNEPLARAIANYITDKHGRHLASCGQIGFELGALDEKRREFSCGELYTRYGENLRGCDVFVVQSTNQPHQNDEELRMMVDTAMLASAARVTAVIPYFGYARQDRKDKSRAPISAVRKVKELVACGTDRLLVLDVHSSAVETAAAALNTPCDHLWARPVFVEFMKENREFIQFMEEGFVVGAPDLNAGKFARGYAEALGGNVPLVLVEKRRDASTGETETLNVIGDPSGKNVLIIDDMIDSGGTVADAARAFKERGAKRIFALATHGVFNGTKNKVSPKLTRSSSVERIIITDSIYRECYPRGIECKVEMVSVSSLLGEAIFRIHASQPVSELF